MHLPIQIGRPEDVDAGHRAEAEHRAKFLPLPAGKYIGMMREWGLETRPDREAARIVFVITDGEHKDRRLTDQICYSSDKYPGLATQGRAVLSQLALASGVGVTDTLDPCRDKLVVAEVVQTKGRDDKIFNNIKAFHPVPRTAPPSPVGATQYAPDTAAAPSAPAAPAAAAPAGAPPPWMTQRG